MFKLYDNGDYNSGWTWDSDRTIYDLSHWDFNDRAKSIRIARGGYKVILCSDANFRGVCGQADRDHGNLDEIANGLQGAVSSAFVCAGQCPSQPTPPILSTPSSGASFHQGDAVLLGWEDTGGEYQAELSGGGLASTQRRDWNRSNQWSVSGLPVSETPYSWHVKLRYDQGNTGNIGESGWSETRTFTVRPPAPATIDATDGMYSDRIQVSWSAVSGATGYELYRAASYDGTKTKIVATSTTSYSDAAVTSGTLYYYWVKACSGSTCSDHSVFDSGYLLAPPACYALTRTHTGSGSDPVASPANSTGCSVGQYVADATISLTASPASG